MAEERCAHPIVMVCWQTDKVFPRRGSLLLQIPA